jgi:phosphohistidine phosphatase
MKTLLILRHAKSSWKDPYLADHDRPLNKRGKRDAPIMGLLLREKGLLPDLILCSTAKRARKTVESVVESSGYDGQVQLTRDFYQAYPVAFFTILGEIPDEYQRVMIVGHNPDLEELVEMLTGDYELMPTAALAQVGLPIQSWEELNEETEGELINIWRPKELSK